MPRPDIGKRPRAGAARPSGSPRRHVWYSRLWGPRLAGETAHGTGWPVVTSNCHRRPPAPAVPLHRSGCPPGPQRPRGRGRAVAGLRVLAGGRVAGGVHRDGGDAVGVPVGGVAAAVDVDRGDGRRDPLFQTLDLEPRAPVLLPLLL